MALRPLSSRQSVLNRADGSCLWKQGATEVLVGVYGPVESQRKREDMNKADLVVQVHPSCGTSNTYTTTLQHFLHSMFQGQILLLLHPRSAIRIIVHLINEAGSELSCCCNAITLALVDAGIPMRSMLASVDIALMSDGSIIPDPTSEVVHNRRAGKDTTGKASDVKVVAVSSFQFNNKSKMVSEWSQVVPSQTQTISINEDQYLDAVALAKTAATKLHNFFKLTTTSKCLYECHGTAF